MLSTLFGSPWIFIWEVSVASCFPSLHCECYECKFITLNENWQKLEWSESIEFCSDVGLWHLPGVYNRWKSMIGKLAIDQSIKLVNWYQLISVNRWSIDNHTKIVHASMGRGPRNRPYARYLSDHPPFLGSPGDETGETIPTQSSQRKEF